MDITQEQTKELLIDLIFTGDRPGDWVQDVWDLSPILGESAASLVDVFDLVLGILNDTQRQELLQKIYHNHQEALKDANVLEKWQQYLEK
ncbi:MAG: hypothetical protein WBB29_00500 [Geitlerinemataceae cyanobacterium]